MAGNVGLLAGLAALSALSAVLVAGAAARLVRPTAVAASIADRPRSVDLDSEPRSMLDEPGTRQGYAFLAPTGQPSSLTCEQAHRIVRQARAALAYEPGPVAPGALAAAAADWLDPHGLWSAAPDSPIPAALDQHAEALLHELEEADLSGCSAARAVGDALVRWTAELGARFDESRRQTRSASGALPASVLHAAAEGVVFEDDVRPARQLATLLGERAGRVESGVGAAVTAYVDVARARFFPSFDGEQWADVVRAAAVRAYVQLVDPHGAWASVDEEASVYDVDLDARPPDRLWDDGVRTAIGVRVESGPMDPLQVGDVVVAIAGMATAGLPVEQLDQLVYATTDAPVSAPIVVLRRGERALRTLDLPAPDDQDTDSEPAQQLPAYRVSFGAGDALIVEIHDVRSDLGDELAATLRAQTTASARAVSGLLLDLRDDGGGSTEGAIAAIGLFLPGVPLFPMVRRDGLIEVDRAPEPPLTDQWTRPVATLVDGDTASAAEMIAGALAAYRRGLVLGSSTYGKGCAQEYLDDVAHVGVLRLTTLLYSLPDGSPVQGVGLEPSIFLPAPTPARSGAGHGREREADVQNAPPTWRGPDVRDRSRVLSAAAASWPDPRGTVGPCRDASVCRALFALAAASPGKRPTAALTPAPAASGRR
jgi:carboxyl-terminal processing protease